jgi:hypothetical protein
VLRSKYYFRCADDLVEMDQELAHDGGDGDAVAFAAGPQLLIKRAQDRVATGRGKCGHIKRPAHFGAAAADVARTGGPAAVTVEGRKASRFMAVVALLLYLFAQLGQKLGAHQAYQLHQAYTAATGEL